MAETPPRAPATSSTDLSSRTDGDLLQGNDGGTADTGFTEVVRRYACSVRATCRRVLGTHADADVDDASQATFLALARRRALLTHERSIAAWLHHVAWCAAVDIARSRSVREVREGAPLTHDAAATADVPHPDLALVDEALAALDPRYRAPLVLHHLEGLSHEEGAAVLQIPTGTFAGQLSRGRRLLAARIERLRQGSTGSVTAMIAAWSAHARSTDCTDIDRLLACMRAPPSARAAQMATQFLLTRTIEPAARISMVSTFTLALVCTGLLAATALLVLASRPRHAFAAAPALLAPQAGGTASAREAQHPSLAKPSPQHAHPQDLPMPEIDVLTVAPHPCGLVRGVLHRATIGTEIRALFDRYYAAAGNIPGKGLNFCLYRDRETGGLLDSPEGIPVEIGTLFSSPIVARPGITAGEIPGGRCAHATLWGEYSGLHALHRALDAWCNAHGESASPLRWEIYGHMGDDMTKVRTDVYVLLKDAHVR